MPKSCPNIFVKFHCVHSSSNILKFEKWGKEIEFFGFLLLDVANHWTILHCNQVLSNVMKIFNVFGNLWMCRVSLCARALCFSFSCPEMRRFRFRVPKWGVISRVSKKCWHFPCSTLWTFLEDSFTCFITNDWPNWHIKINLIVRNKATNGRKIAHGFGPKYIVINSGLSARKMKLFKSEWTIVYAH